MALSPAAMARNVGHAGSFGGNAAFGGNSGHISSGSVGIAPHFSRNSSPVAFKQNFGTAHTYSGPKFVHPHTGSNVYSKHIDRDGDHDRRRHHRGRGGVYFYSYPYYDDYYDYSYYNDDSCSYYWRRYLRTGNPQWKYRYYDCVG
jgi:hypothetical protein